jgi:hypothetical protein
VIQGFEFVDNERTFTCSAEKTHAMDNEVWWWFRVSTDDRQRYAPFPAASSDTQKSVKARIVAFYDDLLVRRATPTIPAWRRGPQQPAAAAAAPAPVKAPEPAPAKPAARTSARKSAARKPAAKKTAAKAGKKPKARSK